MAVVTEPGTLEFWKYDYDDGHIIKKWTNNIRTDSDWSQGSVKISVACDSTTVFYTDSGKSIFRYDLNSSTQLADYDVLSDDSPYLYGGIRVLSTDLSTRTVDSNGLEVGPVVVVAMTKTRYWTE